MMKPDVKRFYREVAVAATDAGGFAILLDGRKVRTPIGRDLEVPTRNLADAVAAEWAAQGDKVRPATMPLTQFAFTAIDRVGPERAEVAARIARYGETDLLCYRADSPADLVALQSETWDPLLAWADEAFGARLTVTAGIAPVAQPAAAVVALGRQLEGLDAFRLTAAAAVVQAAGSLVVGLALLQGRLDAADAAKAAHLDETYQAGKWGEDREAVDRRRALSDEIAGAARFLSLL